MDREAMEFEDHPDEEVSELQMLLTSLRRGPPALPRTVPRHERRIIEIILTFLHLARPQPSALPSAATRRPRTTTRIRRRRSSRLARLYPPRPRASAPVGLPAPGLEGHLAAVDNVDHVQPLEATRSQEREPEVESVMPPPPSIDRIRHGVPSSAGATVPPTRPPTPVGRETARPRLRVVKFRSARWVWIVLSRPLKEPVPPRDFKSSE